ncbi:hypothetical protein IW262DRAFT_628220 [Armillaria fumosa]|nr:hypothetical protein IW262DRAFT_628220 [Armillaria fumosa]
MTICGRNSGACSSGNKTNTNLGSFAPFYEPRFANLKFRLFKLHVCLNFLLRSFISKMPCHRSCKKFAPRSPPTNDEALHASSSLYLPIGEYTARYQPYSLSYRFEGEDTVDVPVPQTPAIIPQTGRFTVPPHYDLDDYIGYESEETDENEDDEDEDEDDQERRHEVLVTPRLVTLCILVLFVWWASYLV